MLLSSIIIVLVSEIFRVCFRVHLGLNCGLVRIGLGIFRVYLRLAQVYLALFRVGLGSIIQSLLRVGFRCI